MNKRLGDIDMSQKVNVVCPLAEKDVGSYYRGLDSLEKYIDVKKFVVIGNDKVKEKVEERGDLRVEFVDENQLVSYSEVKDIIAKISSNNEFCLKRTGWYLQQFLKFSYAFVCEDEYYILWDADTMPIHKHEMFDGDKLVFDVKTEHHEPYFETFSKLFPQYIKRLPYSYIVEHMIIKKSIMLELIEELSKAKVSGESWYEKVLNAINLADLPKSGFSDYETYGLFCLNKYPDVYIERKWDSLRPASSFFEYEKMRDCDYEWLLKDYDAVSFEAYIKVKKYMNIICRNRFVQKRFSCKAVLRKLHQFTI